MDKKKLQCPLEMRRMLGLRKTDSYWLVHKQCFETVIVKGKMRIVIDSFEHWYANQVKYKKVDGPPPGEELRSTLIPRRNWQRSWACPTALFMI